MDANSATVMGINLSVLIPVVVAIITALVAPVYLSRRQSYGTLNARIIEEGRDMRLELRQRIDKLEQRLDSAQNEVQKTLEEIRELRTLNERCNDMIDELRTALAESAKDTKKRLDAIDPSFLDPGTDKT
jgi:peptidoglycan hydrolase CwlO-like protein